MGKTLKNLIYYIKMEYENMRVPELKALARDRGLRNYSRMRKAELVALLQNNPTPSRNRTLGPQLPATGLLHHPYRGTQRM